MLGKLEGYRPLGRLRHIWEDNIRINLRERVWEVMECIYLAQDMDQWQAIVKTTFGFHKRQGIY
jgi:hypothetical protein